MSEDLKRALRTTNLNMLPVLRSVLRHRNLTRAAEELNLTQSAVSNIMKRLREHFSDDLLVRDGREHRLTEKAKRLIEPLEAAMTALEGVLHSPAFDPLTAKTVFRIATADQVSAITLPRIAAMLADEAPQIAVQMITAGARSTEHLLADEIDLIVSPKLIVDPLLETSQRLRNTFQSEPLIEEPFVCIARADNAQIGERLTLADYAALPHAGFALDVNFTASIEQIYLDKHDFKQLTRVTTSEFTILPLVVSQSDCIALVPRSIAISARQSLPIRIMPSPIPVPNLELIAIWNKRRETEPELTWLRALMRRCFASIDALR